MSLSTLMTLLATIATIFSYLCYVLTAKTYAWPGSVLLKLQLLWHDLFVPSLLKMSPPDETSLFRIVKHPMGHGIKAIWVSQFSAAKFNFVQQRFFIDILEFISPCQNDFTKKLWNIHKIWVRNWLNKLEGEDIQEQILHLINKKGTKPLCNYHL